MIFLAGIFMPLPIAMKRKAIIFLVYNLSVQAKA